MARRTCATSCCVCPWRWRRCSSQWLETHYPQRKDKVLNILRSLRGGKLYQSQWGTRMRGEGPFAQLLQQRFELALKRHGIVNDCLPPLNCDDFIADVNATQMNLF